MGGGGGGGGGLSCQTCCDTGPRFTRSHSKELLWRQVRDTEDTEDLFRPGDPHGIHTFWRKEKGVFLNLKKRKFSLILR